MDKLRFITRLKNNMWRTWVTFGKQDFGQKYFSDKALGGKEKSLEAAQAHRDKVIADNRIPCRTFEGNGFHVRDARCSTSSVGISLFVDDRVNPRRVAWKARIVKNGKIVGISASVRKYGYKTAWKMVIALREQHTGISIPECPPPPPDWLTDLGSALEINFE